VTERAQPIPIIRTKLYRPPEPEDLVCRQALHERLDAGLKLPLTLVAAPAGYGKSTAVAHWLEALDIPSAWVSLDEGDGDLGVFLQYFLAAVREMFPEVGAEVQAMLEEVEPVPVGILAGGLINDLATVDTPFVIVLDDYHLLGTSRVDELLVALLKHPPRALHLVIITRRNPSLPLASLRAQGHMTEVRLRDLEFSQDETATLLELVAGQPLERDALAHVHKSTEGWVVGLRLAALAMRFYEDRNEFLRSFSGDIRQVQEYLIAEVMEHEDPTIRDRLCRIAILDRFCAPLCAAVCDVQEGHTNSDENEEIFKALLERSGLLCIALDGHRKWFRFHHLFQDLLRQQLKDRLSVEDITELHTRAAEWLEGEGYLEEATHHLVKTGDVLAMRALILRNRRTLYREEKWLRLDALLSSLPKEVTNADPDLLMIAAWIDIIRQRHTEIWALVERTEELLENQPYSDELAPVFGQLDIFLSWRSWAAADGATALAYAQSALERLPFSYDFERGYAQVMVSASLQMVGRESEGIQYIYDALENDRHAHPSYRVRLLEALGFVLWMAGDLVGLRDAGAAMIRLGEKESLPVTVYNGHYHMGKALYSLGELEQAQKVLSAVIKPGYRATNRFLIRATYFLSLTCESLGQSDRAAGLLETMIAHLLDDSNSFSLAMVKAFQAELALRQDRLADAESWLVTFEPSPTPRGDVSSNDELTATKILFHKGTPAALKNAAEQLDELKAYFENIHNTRFLIETLALQALVFEAQDEPSLAETSLEQAIALAHPRGFIRLFVDLGPEMSRLLNRLKLAEETLRYVGKIQAAFRSPTSQPDGPGTTDAFGVTPVANAPGLLDPLTKREQEILGLLSSHLTAKDIAAQLYISVKTVRRHTENIYGKLGVHGRSEAVAKATGLGILQ
jgi:LuxR family maltose regulon positive regulatory protein